METLKLQKILVTGLGGQLANRLVKVAVGREALEVVGLAREDFDLTNAEAMERVMTALRPDVVLNAAAYTAVDKAEEERELAYAVNADGVGDLAKLCARHHAHFLHISTDYVFDGSASAPYRRDDTTAPLGVYGASKLAGEQMALAACAETRVVRVAWLYDAEGHNFMNTMLRLGRAGKSLRVVDDQVGTPTNAAALAELMLDFAERPDWLPAGVHHFGHRGTTTWHGFAAEVFRVFGVDGVDLAPCSTAEYPTPARRPAYSHLDPEAIHALWGRAPRRWEEEVGQVAGLA